MPEYQMTLMNRQNIARETMAFSLNTNGTKYEFRAGQHADFAFLDPSAQHEGDNWRSYLQSLYGPVYYAAGPSRMVSAMTNLLHCSGVSDDDIKTEEFGDYNSINRRGSEPR